MIEAEIRTTIINELTQIAPEADFEELSPTENIREELDIDSFDFLNFLISLDDKLGVEIPESDYEKLISMDDLIGYLQERID
ncbi:MAG: phosphopantetheine-binding protein [Thermodesulfobacteriota bacterium]|nr:phosphopantetheine-binding protein [Thermodesulfobacteriota bacterium]